MQPGLGEPEPERRIADDLVQVALPEVNRFDVSERRARRGVDVEPGILAEDRDAEQVGRVGDDDDLPQVALVRNLGQQGDLFAGVDGVRLGEDVGQRDSVGEQVVAADSSLGVAGVLVRASAEGDDERRDLALV